jgi:hypothetical protein
LNKVKILGFVAILAMIIVAVPTSYFMDFSLTPTQVPTKEMNFTVSVSSDCLRFLNSSVSTIYVPFTVAANENWQLTINCTKMPGGANGYTDIYLYSGYWDSGVNNTCKSLDLYPILNAIQPTDHQVRLGNPFVETYGGSTQRSYTVFFVVPPGGQQATFHITYEQVF